MKIKLVLSADERNSENSDMLSCPFCAPFETVSNFISSVHWEMCRLHIRSWDKNNSSETTDRLYPALFNKSGEKLLRMNVNPIIDLKAIYTVCLHSKSASWKLMLCVDGGGANIYSYPNNVFIYTPLCFNHFFKFYFIFFFKCYQ